jgi:DNA-binding CsgD family transcriptional regulator
MEERVAQRVVLWLGAVSELLQEPLTQFPVPFFSTMLSSTFDLTGVCWSSRVDDSFGLSVMPGSLRHSGEFWDLWTAGELHEAHPLLRWHEMTHDRCPQSATRVPRGMVRPEDRDRLARMLRPSGCEEQLSIPCRCQGTRHEAFVLLRAAPDFSEADLEVARRIQPTITAVHHQVELLDGRVGLDRMDRSVALGLTGRELVVLQLLADGFPARGIARRMATSPRTIEKHLEHIYRKIGVHDRLNAVRIAQELGLLSRASFSTGRGFDSRAGG